jgi:hypothetical protein
LPAEDIGFKNPEPEGAGTNTGRADR